MSSCPRPAPRALPRASSWSLPGSPSGPPSEAHLTGAREPMQVGCTSLTAAERQQHLSGLCAYCASPDHHAPFLLSGRETARPSKWKEELTWSHYCHLLSPHHFTFFRFVLGDPAGHQKSPLHCLLRLPGSAGNLIDAAFIAQLGVRQEALT